METQKFLGNSNGTVHRGGNFPEIYRNDPNFLYHLFGLLVPVFMSTESEKFTGILEVVQLNPVPVFGATKIPVPFDRYLSPKFLYKW